MDFRLYIWPRYVLKWTGHELVLSPSEGVILSRLASGKLTSYFELTESLYEDREDGGPDDPNNVLAVTLCRLRRKLRGSPVQIARSSDKHVRLLSEVGTMLDNIADEVLTDT